MQKMIKIVGLASALSLFLTGTTTAATPAAPTVDIRWTSYGIPHIKAANELQLGYGVGYVYARDNACLLIEEIITARGERSRYFGAEKNATPKLTNITSDFFYTWLNNPEKVKRFWNAQPEPIQQILTGYEQGFNQYLKESAKKITCSEETWFQPITKDDLVRLARRLLVNGGAGQFVEGIVNAAPPGWPARTTDINNLNDQWLAATVDNLKPQRGSNAIAVGKLRAQDGQGILLANPHFPWTGSSRFYQMHLTIPGELDVMGAGLPGFPFINIGFNRDLAWTHTVDSSAHFTIFKLTLDRKDPTHYIVDGKSIALEKKTLEIQVLDSNGKLSKVTQTLFESVYGPILIWPEKLDWSKKEAYAIRDANLDNERIFQQWYDINRADSVASLRKSVEKNQGAPWVNTVAVDKQGKSIFLNQSVIPYVQAKQLQQCTVSNLLALGLPGLEGSDSTCNWSIDPSAAQAGITPASQLPVIERDDFVQNSNDSAWLSNPAAPLQGYSPLTSADGKELRLRTRFGLSRLQGEHKIKAEDLEKLVFDNQVYLAELIQDDLKILCKKFTENKESAAVLRACSAITNWNGKADTDSDLGIMYFYFFADYFFNTPNRWSVPFDKNNPVTTPRGIALDDSRVVNSIKKGLAAVDKEIQGLKIPQGTKWGDLHVALKGKERIAIPGAHGTLGVYNAMESSEHDGLFEVIGGTSYLQLVTFTADGPLAKGILAFSQSSDHTSPHYQDQTQLFSRKKLLQMPFTDEQINSDPQLKRLQLSLP